MGWCSATDIFDAVAKGLLEPGTVSVKEVLIDLVNALEDGDWDCQEDSDYWDHPVVQEVFRELYPRWFEEQADA